MWTGSFSCIPVYFYLFSVVLSSLPFLLFSVWCVFDWEGCLPFLIGLLLHLMLADWLVLLTFGDVMRSWLAACNLCMNSSIDVFLHCVELMKLLLNSPSFPSFFEGSNIMVLDFFLNAFVLKLFFLFSVCQWLHCSCAKLPDYSPGSLFSMSFSFKRSACIKYHRCSSTELTSVISKNCLMCNGNTHLNPQVKNMQGVSPICQWLYAQHKLDVTRLPIFTSQHSRVQFVSNHLLWYSGQ